MSNAVRVKLVGVDSRTEAGIKLVLSRNQQQKIIIDQSASLLLIDGDSVDGMRYIRDGSMEYAVIMTVMVSRYNEHPHVIQKPLKSDDLVKTLLDVSKELDNHEMGAGEAKAQGNPFAKFHSDQYLASLQKAHQEGPDLEKAAEEARLKAEAEAKAKAEKEAAERAAIEAEKARAEKEAAERDAEERAAKAAAEAAREAEAKAKAAAEKAEQAEQAKRDLAAASFTPAETGPAKEEADAEKEKGRDKFSPGAALYGVRLYPFEYKQAADSKKICGQSQDVSLDHLPLQTFFNVTDYLGHYVAEAKSIALEAMRPVVLTIDNDYMLIHPKDQSVYTSLPETSLYAISLMPLRDAPEIDILETSQAQAEYVQKYDVVYYSNLDYLIAVLALWSSRGRLPEGTSVDEPYQLLQPEHKIFTQLKLPEINRVKEAWANAPMTLKELVGQLLLPQRYIFSFYIVAAILGLFKERDRTAEIKEEAEREQNKQDDLNMLLEELKQL